MRLNDSSTRAFRELWKNDPLRAAHWVSNAAAHAHVETPAVSKLRELLALEGTSKFDATALQNLAAAHSELMQPLASVQTSRAGTLGWSTADEGLEAPAYTGTVRVEDGKVQLSTPFGSFDLATQHGGQWNAKWAAETGAFDKQVVTVRGWPDKAGRALQVESFAPGASASYVQGRVTRTPDGAIALQERPDKLVRITDPKLAAQLEKFMRVAFIMPGEAKASRKPDGSVEWRFDESPKGYYMLTKLNPGDATLYEADTPFEKTHVLSEDGHFPVDKLGHRVFVFGAIADQHEGVVTDRVRKFTADWVSEPILPEWQHSADALGQRIEVEKQPEIAVAALDPRLDGINLSGEFAPEPSLKVQARRLAEAWGVQKKNTDEVKFVKGAKQGQNWEVGAKHSEGPLDLDGKKHGVWNEYRDSGVGGKREIALQGAYEHGERHGVWIQYKDGESKNAWEFSRGKLVASGHVDEQGRPHGAWTLVGRDGLHDGGEGEYDHGIRVRDWWYYKPGTSEYERAEVYHPNGVIAAEGATELTQVGNDKFDLRVGEWKLYDENGTHVDTVMHTTDQKIDGNGEQR